MFFFSLFKPRQMHYGLTHSEFQRSRFSCLSLLRHLLGLCRTVDAHSFPTFPSATYRVPSASQSQQLGLANVPQVWSFSLSKHFISLVCFFFILDNLGSLLLESSYRFFKRLQLTKHLPWACRSFIMRYLFFETAPASLPSPPPSIFTEAPVYPNFQVSYPLTVQAHIISLRIFITATKLLA